jgi:hypothetical protein
MVNFDQDKETYNNPEISMFNRDHIHVDVKNGGAISPLTHTSSWRGA